MASNKWNVGKVKWKKKQNKIANGLFLVYCLETGLGVECGAGQHARGAVSDRVQASEYHAEAVIERHLSAYHGAPLVVVHVEAELMCVVQYHVMREHDALGKARSSLFGRWIEWSRLNRPKRFQTAYIPKCIEYWSDRMMWAFVWSRRALVDATTRHRRSRVRRTHKIHLNVSLLKFMKKLNKKEGRTKENTIKMYLWRLLPSSMSFFRLGKRGVFKSPCLQEPISGHTSLRMLQKRIERWNIEN